MGSLPLPTAQQFTLVDATEEDMTDMASIFLRALSWDPLAQELDKHMSFEQQVTFVKIRDMPRMTFGREWGACRTWKVVDGEGKTVAWGGLGIPVPLSIEQAKALQSGLPVEHLPKDFDVNLAMCLHTVNVLYKECLEKHGYDASKHFMRQSTMVDTPYQKMGIGRMITRKCNEIADAAGAPTFVKARPTSKHLFESEGYKVLEEILMNYEDFGLKGKTSAFVMKREVGGR